ncbi:transcriptional regulator [Saccharibacillus sp. O23]|uniref:ROK family protein n=1 Tax=Saccharibacillus sp. O23 TaxID=2009338 RepID=UPI000B4E23CF|nr:ROK family protein [Saccharibacillus sp. O23]OWR29587.1 transcriptional regulator [Saccharibacillus sp. O23]
MNSVTPSSIKVKRMNEERVRQALRASESATKSQIAQTTGLSVATCGTLLGEMLETGEALEDEPEESSGGRRARRFVYNADHSHIACVCAVYELERPMLIYAVADSFGRVLERRSEEAAALDEAAIDTLVGRLLVNYPQIKALGIGIPGLVHKGVIHICDAAELIGVPLAGRLREKYAIKVTVENDMNLTVYGLYRRNEWEEPGTVAAMIFERGCFPGAGLMIDGRIHRGSSRFAGEVSFLPFGVSREEQLRRLNVKETFVPLAAHAVASLAAIVNPKIVALTGAQVAASDLAAIRERCLAVIPPEHMPELTFLEAPREPYIEGLIAMTLESLSYSFELVEKKY